MVTETVSDTNAEDCEGCGRETPHQVRIEIRAEADSDVTAAFSREPYRIATCHRFGHEVGLRMNNA